ncbi:CARDB domain-containing protein [Terrabacter sp. BE26]|uniref:CARDB domain-containing protein n=1 Tax=Terrabacter sp. BE26 TaxID=2898152 RepID=UPI0035BE14C5
MLAASVVGATNAYAACSAPVDANISVSPSQGPPGTIVTVGGQSSAGNTITVEGFGTSANTVSGTNGTYSARLTVPPATSPDCYDLRITSSPPGGGLGTFSFARFTVTPGTTASPDLVPTAITVNGAVPGAALQAGKSVHFDSGVRNQGSADSGVFNIRWLVDGRDVGAYGSHAGVPANTTVLDGNSQFDWTFTAAGSYTVTFAVDVDNHVAESNESNNSLTVQVHVIGTARGTLAPVAAGTTFTVIHGYNDPPKNANPLQRCSIATSRDHCANQQYGLDLQPGVNWDKKILAPEDGTPQRFVKGSVGASDCLLFRLRDGRNMNICHFGGGGRSDILGRVVPRGTVLGTSGSSWIHLSIDERPTTCSGGYSSPASYYCPVSFTATHAFEGQDLTPDGTANQWVRKTFTSSNVELP